jgi:hypothetical protein
LTATRGFIAVSELDAVTAACSALGI